MKERHKERHKDTKTQRHKDTKKDSKTEIQKERQKDRKRERWDFFKRGHREVEKTFNQVFFMLQFFPVNIGYFRVKMTETSTLGLNYKKIRTLLGKRALTP